jgi:L-lactate dehydrogenase (cytochrome)
MAANVADLAALALRQRVLRDVRTLSLQQRLFGQSLSMPVLLGPVGLAGMYARRGEVAAARAAAKAGIPFCLSTSAVCSVEEVRGASPAPPWFQLYMIKDRSFMLQLLERAQATECPVLMFTADLAVPATRYRDVRSGFAAKLSPRSAAIRMLSGLAHPLWLTDVYVRGRPHVLGNIAPAMAGASASTDFWGWVKRNWDSGVTWDDIDWLRRRWSGPIVLKGVLDDEDACRAIDAGVDGLVVSNHGGRQLDSALSTARALPSVAEAVRGRVPVLVDGGVRTGLDVLKMLALGAQGCLLGRAWAFALAAAGEAGVTAMLARLRAELETAMALTGCTDVRTASPHLLDRRADTTAAYRSGDAAEARSLGAPSSKRSPQETLS